MKTFTLEQIAKVTGGMLTKAKDVAITKNTVFEADFDKDENVTVTVTFYDGDRSALTTGITIPYGSAISYETYGLKVPTKASNEKAYYEFDGWTLGNNTAKVYGVDKEITLYNSTNAYSHFKEYANNYTVRFVNNAGNPFLPKGSTDPKDELGISDNVTYGSYVSGVDSILNLKDALAKLNDREKEIVMLRYYVGKTQMEVSEEIGISQAQVSRLEKNAIKEIRKAF